MARLIWIQGAKSDNDEPIELAIKWRNREATNPRDNVYAFTGLYTAGTLLWSERCDYSLSVDKVFINFTLDLIYRRGHAKHCDLQPLTLDTWEEGCKEIPGLPRWAIDMRSMPKCNSGC